MVINIRCLYKDKIYLFEFYVIFEVMFFIKVKYLGFWYYRQRMIKMVYKRGIIEIVVGV